MYIIFLRGLFTKILLIGRKIVMGGAHAHKLSAQNCQYLEYRWRYRKTVEILGFSKGVCTLWLLFIGWKKSEWGVRVRRSFQYKIVNISSTVGDIEKRLKFWGFLKGFVLCGFFLLAEKNRSGEWACARAFSTKLSISRVPLKISKNGWNFGVF